jgi:hypothetical protein
MTEFVLYDDTEESHLGNGHLLVLAHDGVSVRDATNILHSSIFVIRAHNMIDFGERISRAEVLLVKFNGSLGDSKYKFVLHVVF